MEHYQLLILTFIINNNKIQNNGINIKIKNNNAIKQNFSEVCIIVKTQVTPVPFIQS